MCVVCMKDADITRIMMRYSNQTYRYIEKSPNELGYCLTVRSVVHKHCYIMRRERANDVMRTKIMCKPP